MQILYCNRMSSHYFSPFCLWFTTTGQQQPWYHLLTRYLHSPPRKSDKWAWMKRRPMMSFRHFLEPGTQMLRATLHAPKTTNSTTTFFFFFHNTCQWWILQCSAYEVIICPIKKKKKKKEKQRYKSTQPRHTITGLRKEVLCNRLQISSLCFL